MMAPRALQRAASGRTVGRVRGPAHSNWLHRVAAAKGTRDVSENITEVSNSAVKTGHVATTVLTAAGELAGQSHLLRQEVERYLAQLRVAS